MLATILAVALIHDITNATDPKLLVRQLGSTRYASRIEAEGELIRLGQFALPALRAAKDFKDAEIRTRSLALVSQIEKSLILQATDIVLNIGDLTVPDAVGLLGGQIGQSIVILPEDRPNLDRRRFTLKTDQPLPFWKAIDSICLAARLHPVVLNRLTPGDPGGTLVLHDGRFTGTNLVSDEGPFRVQLLSVHQQSEIQLTEGQSHRSFFLQMELVAEPRLSVTRGGAVQVTSAIDEQGRSVINPGIFQQEAGYYGISPSPVLRFRVDLDEPSSRSQRLKTLQGKLPVIVATRKLDPLEVTLTESMGKIYTTEDTVLTVVDYHQGTRQDPSTIQLITRPVQREGELPASKPGEPLGYRPDPIDQQIELLDAQGQTMEWFPSSQIFDGEETRLTLTISRQSMATNPVKLRFHSLLRSKTDVSFQFNDIPIP